MDCGEDDGVERVAEDVVDEDGVEALKGPGK